MSCASLWTALRIVYDIAVWFCSGKCSELRSSSYDCLLVGLRSWIGLLYCISQSISWAEKPDRSFILYFPEY